MKNFSRYFLIGFVILLPVIITVQILIWLVQTVEGWLKPMWLIVLPEQIYFPGLALLSFVAMITVIGYLSRNTVIEKLLDVPGRLMERVPVVHQVYTTVRDFFRLLGGDEFKNHSVVWVRFPGTKARLLGLITEDGDSNDSELAAMMEDDEVAVFLPMSYQAGGYMVVVSRDLIEASDLKPGEALRLVMTAGLGGQST